ncbi:hypothetical protein ACIP88_04695 [Streptomyces uncialis]|uniref:hypothetical protein n=1 Tax=Streptomyces uncialis TaxID=1048205 RepID=UPI00382A4E94
MSTAVRTRTRDPRTILNALGDRVPHLVTEVGVADLWEREVRLLLRDSVAVRSLAERIRTPRKWESLLLKAGFLEAEARVIEAPTPGHIGTLIVRARVAETF